MSAIPEYVHSLAPCSLAPYSIDVRGPVDAPNLAERVACLAHGRPGGQRLAKRVQDVVLALRSALDAVQAPAHRRAVPAAPQVREPRGLLLLDCRVNPQRGVALVGVDTELVQPDNNALTRVDLPGHLVRGTLDLRLLKSALDRGDGAAQLLDPADQPGGLLPDGSGHRLDHVGAGERV